MSLVNPVDYTRSVTFVRTSPIYKHYDIISWSPQVANIPPYHENQLDLLYTYILSVPDIEERFEILERAFDMYEFDLRMEESRLRRKIEHMRGSHSQIYEKILDEIVAKINIQKDILGDLFIQGIDIPVYLLAHIKSRKGKTKENLLEMLELYTSYVEKYQDPE